MSLNNSSDFRVLSLQNSLGYLAKFMIQNHLIFNDLNRYSFGGEDMDRQGVIDAESVEDSLLENVRWPVGAHHDGDSCFLCDNTGLVWCKLVDRHNELREPGSRADICVVLAVGPELIAHRCKVEDV